MWLLVQLACSKNEGKMPTRQELIKRLKEQGYPDSELNKLSDDDLKKYLEEEASIPVNTGGAL